jgi:cytochrome c-type biogenesis protein CcmH
MIWAAIAVMTGAAVLCALWPLARAAAPEREDPSVAFHKAQLAQINLDVQRGQLPQAEAAGARTETARRLIAAADNVATVAPPSRLRRNAAALVIVAAPLLALGLYGRYGRPDLPDQPILARSDDPIRTGDLASAVAKIEAHLASHPDDGQGFKVIAPAYLRLGRPEDAVDAYRSALRLLGENPQMRADYGEALVAAAGGLVTADARTAFEKALATEADLVKARYYLGLAAEQDGDAAHALDVYRGLVAAAPPDAPWVGGVRARIEALSGAAPASGPAAPGAGAIAALPPEQRQAAIRGMVEGLAQRLAQNGDDVAGWLRLIRAWTVLQEPDKAIAALKDARKALGANATALGQLDALAGELKIGG